MMRAAAEFLTPVTLELGGKSPVIIDEKVNMDVAVKRILWGKCMNAGQTCVAPDYVLIHKTREEEFLTKLKNKIVEFFGENVVDSKDFERIINEKHVDRISSLLKGLDDHIYAGGQIDKENRFIAPTIIRNPPLESQVMQEEIFGPILPVIPIESIDDAISFINSKSKPLALYIFSSDKKVVDKVINNTSSGAVGVNEVVMHFTCIELPFGGVGDSGIGSYHGKSSFETFTHYKSVLDKSTALDPSIRYPPYHEKKVKILLRLMNLKISSKAIYIAWTFIFLLIAYIVQLYFK